MIGNGKLTRAAISSPLTMAFASRQGEGTSAVGLRRAARGAPLVVVATTMCSSVSADSRTARPSTLAGATRPGRQLRVWRVDELRPHCGASTCGPASPAPRDPRRIFTITVEAAGGGTHRRVASS